MADFLSLMARIKPPDFNHVIIDDNYPIKKGSVNHRVEYMAKKYGCIYLNSGKNLGLHKALNFGIREVGVDPDDFYINCDADDRPQPGMFDAMYDVMKVDLTLAVLGCQFSNINPKLKALPTEQAGGHEIIIHPSVDMWNVSAINMRFIKAIGGFDEPYPFYGGIESYLYSKYNQMGMRLGYLKGFSSQYANVDNKLIDPEFTEYKQAHVAGPVSYAGSFESFLKEKYPNLL